MGPFLFLNPSVPPCGVGMGVGSEFKAVMWVRSWPAHSERKPCRAGDIPHRSQAGLQGVGEGGGPVSVLKGLMSRVGGHGLGQ